MEWSSEEEQKIEKRKKENEKIWMKERGGKQRQNDFFLNSHLQKTKKKIPKISLAIYYAITKECFCLYSIIINQ